MSIIKLKPFNPKSVYPLGFISIVFSGLILRINYQLIGNSLMVKRLFQKIILWSFLITVGFGAISVMFYDKTEQLHIILGLYYFSTNILVTHFWVKEQYKLFRRG